VKLLGFEARAGVHTGEVEMHWTSPELADSTVAASISGPPVILQSTHEAALDVVDLADLKRRALELS